jgi:hypothetical protein
MKDRLLTLTRKHLGELTAMQKAIRSSAPARITQMAILATGQKIARMWFDEVRPALERAAFQPEALASFSTRFETLLKFSNSRPMKSALLPLVSDGISPYKDLIHQIEIGSFSNTGGLNIAPYIQGLPNDEGDYLDEAQRCLSANALRGCIVLGWCATIARVHAKIGEIGYEKFNKASEEMKAKTVGRYKPFNKQYTIDSLSELQRIFDTDILWVLEYLNLIDSNQHQRLRHCFEFRNNSAHPGLAPITGENLYSFFSDITKIVLKNPNFELKKPVDSSS